MYAIVDIETTGGHASANGITEIAICLHDGKKITKRFSTLVNPRRDIPIYIRALTGITNEMVAEAPPFEDVAADIYHLLHAKYSLPIMLISITLLCAIIWQPPGMICKAISYVP